MKKVGNFIYRNWLKLLLTIPFLFSLAIPFIASAGVFWHWGDSLVPATAQNQQATSVCQLIELGLNIIKFGFTLAVEIIGPIAIAIGAFYIMTAGGSPDRFKKGQQTILYAVIGMILALASYTILSLFIWILLGGPQSINLVSWFNTSNICSQ